MSDEWVMVPREPTAVQLIDGAYEVPDPISHRGELTARMVYRAMLDAAPAAPVQAEPVWARPDQLRQVPFLCALYKTQAAPDLVPLYRHPPPAEVDALKRTHDEAMKRSHEVTQEMARQFETEVEALRADSERLTGERDVAIEMLAYWCVAVDQNGTGWDDWDEHYKDAMYRPCPIRELLDKEINAARAAQGDKV